MMASDHQDSVTGCPYRCPIKTVTNGKVHRVQIMRPSPTRPQVAQLFGDSLCRRTDLLPSFIGPVLDHVDVGLQSRQRVGLAFVRRDQGCR